MAADESGHHYAAGRINYFVGFRMFCDFTDLSDRFELAIVNDYRMVGEYSMARIHSDDYAALHQDRCHNKLPTNQFGGSG
jgi:hypothetical protein